MGIWNTLFGGQGAKNVIVLNPAEFKTGINRDNIQIVDVRTAAEFKSGHIKGALNIDFFEQAKFKNKLAKLDPAKPIYIYCRSGNRSKSAAGIISKMGFKQIYDLRGGYNAWS